MTATSFAAILLAVLGAAVAAVVVRGRARRHGLHQRWAVDGLFVMIAAGLLVGHVADVALYRFDELSADWRAILPGSGGACSLGAFIGGGLAGYLWFRRAPEGLWRYADQLAVALTLGWGIARLGCFVSHDHLGAPTPLPLGALSSGRHDLGLYEAILALSIWAALLALEGRPRQPGRLLLVAALAFAAARFGLEFLAEDPRYLGLTLVQWAMPWSLLLLRILQRPCSARTIRSKAFA
jgi:phosphatidylglycerol:prolipoprotein diacylglycerol transferase